jgi:hypothetical protein
MYRTFACTVFATLLLVTPLAQKGTTIRIWKVGSPHTGDTPHTEVPPLLAREVASRGWRLSIDAFPAQSFADWFFAAVRDGSAPDLLVFDNFGIMEGISTRLGTFVAIDQDPVIRNQLVQAIGHASLLLAFRKTSWLWQLLVGARDPVSNRDFVTLLPGFAKVLARDLPAGPVPLPATLRSPRNGRFPIAGTGERFGDFEWQSSSTEDVVAEIVEFSYHDDARLFLLRPLKPGVPRHVSAGQLWSTRSDWAWRVWSITKSGEIAFSEARTFVH